MEVRYHRRFDRDLGRIRDRALSRSVEQVIEELKAASNITDVRNVVKMVGWERHYRIRVGNYRLGLEMDGDVAILTRFRHRREFYRYFP